MALQVEELRAMQQSGSDSEGGDKFPPALTVDTKRERYPFCIVWTPIPCLTWIAPFVGHMGVADSRGVIYDFGKWCCAAAVNGCSAMLTQFLCSRAVYNLRR